MGGCFNTAHKEAISLLKCFPIECLCPVLTLGGLPSLRTHVHCLKCMPGERPNLDLSRKKKSSPLIWKMDLIDQPVECFVILRYYC